MAEQTFTPYAITSLEEAPVGCTVIVATSHQPERAHVEITKVARHTPSGQIALENGARYFQRRYGGREFGGHGDARGHLFRFTDETQRMAAIAMEAQRKEEEEERLRLEARRISMKAGDACRAFHSAHSVSGLHTMRVIEALLKRQPITEAKAAEMMAVLNEPSDGRPQP